MLRNNEKQKPTKFFSKIKQNNQDLATGIAVNSALVKIEILVRCVDLIKAKKNKLINNSA
jgi:hypothetical protein